MTYFRELPNVEYQNFLSDSTGSLDYILMKNIFIRGKLRDDLQNVLTVFDKYVIIGDFQFYSPFGIISAYPYTTYKSGNPIYLKSAFSGVKAGLSSYENSPYRGLVAQYGVDKWYIKAGILGSINKLDAINKGEYFVLSSYS